MSGEQNALTCGLAPGLHVCVCVCVCVCVKVSSGPKTHAIIKESFNDQNSSCTFLHTPPLYFLPLFCEVMMLHHHAFINNRHLINLFKRVRAAVVPHSNYASLFNLITVYLCFITSI